MESPTCIVCGEPSRGLFATKKNMTVAYCDDHAYDCVLAKAACWCSPAREGNINSDLDE